MAQAATCPVDGRERRLAFNKIKNKGNLSHNIKVLGGSDGKVIVARRSKFNNNVDDYLPCPSCYGIMIKYELWRHYQHHTQKCMKLAPKVPWMCRCKRFYYWIRCSGNLKKRGCCNIEAIAGHNAQDTIFETLNNDALILRLGVILLTTLGMKRKKT